MKYWAEKRQPKILLIDGGYDRVISISKLTNGEICFCEECDEEFDVTLSKEDAISALQEAIDWIKNQF